MKTPNPIKRSKQLVPLSREHHDALLFIWKIRRGLKSGTPARTIAEYIKWFRVNHLDKHFHQEENLLLPYLPAEDPLAQQLIKEHEVIRGMMDQDLNENAIAVLCDALNDHIRFEERKLFTHVERIIPEDQLNAIFVQLNDEPSCVTRWENEFWNK